MGRAVPGLIFILATGCSFSSQKPGLLEARVPEARISSALLRVWVHDAVLDAADQIEETADRIRDGSREPVVRRNALLWKINAIQLFFRAAARREPLGAYVDLWIFCVQMEEFFDDGSGRDAFGPFQVLALTTASGLRAQMEETFKAALKPEFADQKLGTVQKFIETFAKSHPLQTLHFRREPLTGHASSRAIPDVEGLGAVVAGLEQDLVTIQRIATAYLEYLPSIARWQADLLLEDAGRTGVVAESASVLKGIPDLVSGQTSRVLSAITAERTSAMASLEEMRAATLKTMETERKAVTAEIDRQRRETVEQVQEERKAVLQEIRVIARDTAAAGVSPGKQLIDHLVRKILLVGAAVAGFFVLAVGLVMALLRSKAAGPAPPPAL